VEAGCRGVCKLVIVTPYILFTALLRRHRHRVNPDYTHLIILMIYTHPIANNNIIKFNNKSKIRILNMSQKKLYRNVNVCNDYTIIML